MRIALVSPLYERVPPELYGGTERVVHCLAEELVRRGHEVTLFASGDSLTSARLVACEPESLRMRMTREELLTVGPLLHVAMMAQVIERADEFDLIHSHIEHWGLPFTQLTGVPVVSTLHGRQDIETYHRIFRLFPDAPLVSISERQRSPLIYLNLNWAGTVYNGIDCRRFTFNPAPGDYLVFIGRISPEKRPDRAIEIARRIGMPLKIAAKVDQFDREYFESEIEPLLDGPLFEFIGEVDDARKDELLRGAYATLFPIDWPEPFGLTMVESMACGTPVIAMRHGSVPEVMLDGVTGFVCNSLDEMIAVVPRVAGLDRTACRQHVEARFSSEAMANGYEQVYRRLLGYEAAPVSKILSNSHHKPVAALDTP